MKQALWLLLWNIAVFLMYGLDKAFAKGGKRRIRETVLLFSAFLMGGVGAALSMIAFHHKVSKPKFRALVPLFVVLNFFVLWYFSGKF